ncbi:MAG TPA: acetate/propionate family kinase [Candidatus Acidoferrales bacterium]|jgi:acetate kinase|nr:acetate/propionate family kinase [Candidatus Acidoferrales bacterium]
MPALPLEQQTILTINRGSGTLKAALYQATTSPALLASIKVDRAGTPEARIKITDASEKSLLDSKIQQAGANSDLTTLLKWLEQTGQAAHLVGIGHRLVHGGPRFTESQRITLEVLAELEKIAPLDPDHTPQAIQNIRFFSDHLPHTPQIGCFDTAFHATLPKVARVYALPRKFYDEGIRRYGFHGLSCEYILQQLRATDPALAAGRLIIAHLGNGASMTAVSDGRSVDTSMGFTPLEGLVMGTRSGDLDPAAVIYLQQRDRLSPRDVDVLLNKRSGLLGLSGTSGDMRDLLEREAADERAAEAIALFCYRARKYVGAYAAALGGLDALIFAGGIGENAPAVRERICAVLDFLGLEIDAAANRSNAPVISTNRARAKIKVIKTDEDIVIAQHVLAVVGKPVLRG